jgi:hypothetical protein
MGLTNSVTVSSEHFFFLFPAGLFAFTFSLDPVENPVAW